jgi:hypothetical protein
LRRGIVCDPSIVILEHFGVGAVIYTCGVAAVLSLACFVLLAIQVATPAYPDRQA